MKFKFTWGRKLIAGILLAAVVVGGTAAPAEAASKNHTAVVAQDNYRKTLCKGFLGKSYGSVVDGIRCDCSGYTRAALNRLESKGRKGTALKNVSVGAHCTRDWVSGSSISYTTGVATKGAIQWNSGTKKSIGRKSSGKSLSQLELGDVVVYGKGNRSNIKGHFRKKFRLFELEEEPLPVVAFRTEKEISDNYTRILKDIERVLGMEDAEVDVNSLFP